MKNFIRALRCALPYRGRLILSIVCAFLAAVFWGLNFTAIYPVLKILGENKNIHQWVDSEIKATQATFDTASAQAGRWRLKYQEWEDRTPSRQREKELNTAAHELARVQSRLDTAASRLSHLRLVQRYICPLVPTDRFQTLALVIGLVVVAVAIKGFFEFGQDVLVGSVMNLSLFDLRNRFYRNVIHLDVSQFSEDGTHGLMARFTNDMELLGNGIKALFGKVVAEPLRALACVVVAAYISWQLTLMFLVLVPVALFILTRVGRMMKRASRRLLERMSNIYKILQETFLGIRVVKAFTMEPYERRRFCTATRDYYHKAMMVVKLDALAGPIVEFLGVAAIALALLAGAYLVLSGDNKLWGMNMSSAPLEMASLLSLYACLAGIADPVRKLSSVMTRIQSGCAAADRIFDYLDRQSRVRSNAGGDRLGRHRDSIEFRDVCFSYDPGRPILTNVHLKIRHGETIALVGKNGCGKTTLVGLLPRFYDPDHGSIQVDGKDIRDVNLRSLRQQIGIVTQETTLFDDTIYNNIAYGNRRARREDVEEASKRAFAHDFIMKLPAGYETRIGEAGAKLSGGQKQRLSLARAILRDPAIFILDEFTSQSDTESEALIHRALKEFTRDRTTLLITHRLNTLEIADRIVVVDNGRIEAVGSHAELLRTSPAYQRLHEIQLQRLSA